MHAPIAMTVMWLGKHVYGQKPLAHDHYEVRRMSERAQEKRVVTQMGIQIHSSAQYQSVVKASHGGGTKTKTSQAGVRRAGRDLRLIHGRR